MAKGMPLVITYHSLLRSVGTILYKHLNLLHMDKEVKKAFPVALIPKCPETKQLPRKS